MKEYNKQIIDFIDEVERNPDGICKIFDEIILNNRIQMKILK